MKALTVFSLLLKNNFIDLDLLLIQIRSIIDLDLLFKYVVVALKSQNENV